MFRLERRRRVRRLGTTFFLGVLSRFGGGYGFAESRIHAHSRDCRQRNRTCGLFLQRLLDPLRTFRGTCCGTCLALRLPTFPLALADGGLVGRREALLHACLP